MDENFVELPGFSRHVQSPAIHTTERPAIALSCPASVRGADGRFPLYGSFAIPKACVAEVEGNLLRAVVIVIRGPFPASRSVGEGRILFKDDVAEDGESVYGFFNLNLFEEFNLMADPNLYWVNASILDWVSNVVTTRVV